MKKKWSEETGTDNNICEHVKIYKSTSHTKDKNLT